MPATIRLFVSILPGKVSSEYFANNPGSEERIPWIGKLIPVSTPEQVADGIVRGIERESREVVMPAMLRVFMILHWIMPRAVEACVRFSGHKHGS